MIVALALGADARSVADRTTVNRDATRAVNTSSDPSSTSGDRFTRVTDLQESVDGGSGTAGDTQLGLDSRTSVNSLVGGDATFEVRDKDDGAVLSSSTTSTYGDNDATSTITRVVDVEDDRSTVVGTGSTTSYGGGTGSASSSGAAYAVGDCDFTNLRLTGTSSTVGSSAFTEVYTNVDCTVQECDGTPVSLVFVNDESGSISSTDFTDAKNFIAEIIAKVDSGSEVAYVEFESSASLQWGFTSPVDALT